MAIKSLPVDVIYNIISNIDFDNLYILQDTSKRFAGFLPARLTRYRSTLCTLDLLKYYKKSSKDGCKPLLRNIELLAKGKDSAPVVKYLWQRGKFIKTAKWMQVGDSDLFFNKDGTLDTTYVVLSCIRKSISSGLCRNYPKMVHMIVHVATENTIIV